MSDLKDARKWLKKNLGDWTDEDAVNLAVLIDEKVKEERNACIESIEYQLELCDQWGESEEVKEGVNLARGAVTIRLYED